MNIGEFFSQYRDNESCKAFFRQQKERSGIRCKRCGGTAHYWIESLTKWECKRCKHRTSIKAGTVMEHSYPDYRVWLWALYLMAMTN